FQAILLMINLIFLILLIRRFSPTAAYLLLPYSGWVMFATILTFSVWMIN
ncbi:MAG: tryptophan-rich sensory protein, partial [Ignavibacteriaceae bacterium]|nr:tryptophan-rich sensory protein [Ignavibacteriaceae bacterium]